MAEISLINLSRKAASDLIRENSGRLYDGFPFKPSVRREDFVGALYYSLSRQRSSERAFGFVRAAPKQTGGMLYHPLAWDSSLYGLSISKADVFLLPTSVSIEKQVVLLNKLRAKLAAENIDLLFVRQPVTEWQSVIALTQSGGIPADVLMFFHFSSHRKLYPSAPRLRAHFRKAKPGDVKALQQLARVSFRTSHFYMDARLPRRTTDELYARWIANSMKERSGTVIVTESHGNLSGFVSCKLVETRQAKSHGVIDLIATEANLQGIGIGRELVLKALEWFAERTGHVYVGTQAGNIPAIRLYEGAGFKTVGAEATIHFWTR